MSQDRHLVAAFLAKLPEPLRQRLAVRASLGEQLAEAVRAAAAAWPGLELDPTRFGEHLAAELAEDADPARPLAALYTDDLYLACACLQRAAGSAEKLEAYCISGIEPALASIGLDAGKIEEIKQLLRSQLLVEEPGRQPLIGRYAGRGPLPAWVRVVALRLALKQQQRGRRELSIDEQMLEAMPLQTDDAELQYLKNLYRLEFQQAFAEALRSLPARETNLLLHHYLDGLTTHQIGALYRVNQSTAARWLQRARELIFGAIRDGLERRLGAEPGEAESIMRLVHSRLDLTLRGLLRR